MRVFRHRDFRILWTGALLSFIGSSIQTVAQGWFVFELTHDESKLALVTFCTFLPVSLIGPAAGTLADMLNKRIVLVICQAMLALCALYLAIATHFGFIQYWHILAVASVTGLVQAVEMPTRQSIVGRVVPPEEMPKAVPMQAMTFNIARFIGPSLGGFLLAWFGVPFCYFVNAISFIALIFAGLTIRADLRPQAREPQPIGDLIAEGALYTFRNPALRVLFLLEAAVAALAIQYIYLMPALAKKIWGLDEAGLGWAMSMVGIGAISGLLLMANLPRIEQRTAAIRISVTVMGCALIVMGLAPSVWIGFPMVALAGMAQVAQFNTTNTLFQLLSPPHLRGRVLAMHMWAITGLSPIGTLFFGWLAKTQGNPVSLMAGGCMVLLVGAWGWTQNKAIAQAVEQSKDASLGAAVWEP